MMQLEIASAQSVAASQPDTHWYAIRTKSNCERPVAQALGGKGFEVFLPEYRVRRQSFGRVNSASAPLFAGYLFCHFDFSLRVRLLSTPGVVSIVGFANEPAAIPDDQIQAVQALLASGLGVETCAYLSEGQRVRIRRGPFQNLEGLLVAKKSECRFVVSVPLLQRSVSVEIDPAWISAV